MRLACLLLAVALGLCGCTPNQPSSTSAQEQPADSAASGQGEQASGAYPEANSGAYQAPAMATAAFHADLAEGDAGVLVDCSATEQGYVAVSAVADATLKCQVLKGEETYTYDLASDGTPSIYPLQCGDGEYTLRVLKNVVDKKYAELYTTYIEVTTIDEFQPYLRPSDYVNYQADSQCVAKAQELAASADTALQVVTAVYDYICANVTYDTEKAKTVSSGYLPDPDDTLRTGTGICFDYAALAAAMLRSQGIPTKVIFGYVSPNGLYHAWNMFYTEETGWVTVDYQVSGAAWNRLDLTFSANGADSTFVGDGGNYTDLYFY
jgi:hypothetical protein